MMVFEVNLPVYWLSYTCQTRQIFTQLMSLFVRKFSQFLKKAKTEAQVSQNGRF